ncbi:MAG: hypothetical protein QOE26_2215 [Verrucomicrobiota bacterium]|jgi:hypothetical protein
MRSRTIIPLIIIALIFGICSQSYAPIYGGFPGVDELIARADAIIVGTIIERTSEWDFGGSAYYRVSSDRTLKGNLGTDTLTVNMRQLDLITPADKTSKNRPLNDGSDFRIDSRYTIFLVKTKDDPKASYTNINCEGSSFEVSRYLRLETLGGKSIKEALKFLLLDFSEYQRARLKHVEERTKIYLRDL